MLAIWLPFAVSCSSPTAGPSAQPAADGVLPADVDGQAAAQPDAATKTERDVVDASIHVPDTAPAPEDTSPPADTAAPAKDVSQPPDVAAPKCKSGDCDDGNGCTTDVCDPESGCTHPANNKACSDGDPCTVQDSCAATKCSGKPKPCDDNKPCTADSCDPKAGCQHGPDCQLPQVCGAGGKKGVCAKPPPLPYPNRTPWQIKAIQPDFWPNRQEIIGNKAGGIAANMVWASWQPAFKKPPCKTKSEVAYEGACFTINKGVEAEIAAYSKAGLVVSGIFWGVPEWARIPAKDCSPAGGDPAFKVFCAPKQASDFGRFVGFIADRYDGLHGVGRVADFVIHNEVNANSWFDIGCGDGKACSVSKWLDVYAANYNAAYDRVTKHQPQARVLISLMHAWNKSHDKPAASSPVLSGQTFLEGFAKRVGKRSWRVAWHPYPSNLLSPAFDALDHDKHGKVTYGNPGVLVGWLHKHFANVPSALEVQFTESGVNSIGPQSNNAGQADGVCRSLTNVLATPGVINYIYHRMKDHPVEVKQGLGLGLWNVDGKNKLAWSTWALANNADLKPSKLDCGFQHLPYVLLRRGYKSGKGHWASSTLLPAGFKKEKTWRLLRAQKPGTKLIFACQVGGHNLLSPSPACENLTPLGPVGWVHNKKAAGLVPLNRCRIGPGADHFVSSDGKCEGQVFEQTLGWVLPGS